MIAGQGLNFFKLALLLAGLVLAISCRQSTPSPVLPATPCQPEPGRDCFPTLADFWAGKAVFVLDVVDTGLPMGESEAVLLENGEVWSYLHASWQSAGTVDQCGEPVPFPGCTVIYRSQDGGTTFGGSQVCQFECRQCPCDSEHDHIEQQQYPRLFRAGPDWYLVYEYLGRTMLRRSMDGLDWSRPEQIAQTGIWKIWLRPCSNANRIGSHPFVPYDYECLAGGPPGIFVVGEQLFVFVAVGQNPAGMGCYVGRLNDPGRDFTPCQHNPLFRGASDYGPLNQFGVAANPYFDFRTISSAEVVQIGDRYYMLYEGIRGPGPGDGGDSQFGLGLARSLTNQIDGPWEKFLGNPILADLPGNVGLGHADLLIYNGQTLLYTSLDGQQRSRLRLVWSNP